MLSEYWIDWPYAACTWSASRQTSSGDCALRGHAVEDRAVADLRPSRPCRGSGAHGVWLETRSISAITGRSVRLGAARSRWNADRMYWSGIAA